MVVNPNLIAEVPSSDIAVMNFPTSPDGDVFVFDLVASGQAVLDVSSVKTLTPFRVVAAATISTTSGSSTSSFRLSIASGSTFTGANQIGNIGTAGKTAPYTAYISVDCIWDSLSSKLSTIGTTTGITGIISSSISNNNTYTSISSSNVKFEVAGSVDTATSGDTITVTQFKAYYI